MEWCLPPTVPSSCIQSPIHDTQTVAGASAFSSLFAYHLQTPPCLSCRLALWFPSSSTTTPLLPLTQQKYLYPLSHPVIFRAPRSKTHFLTGPDQFQDCHHCSLYCFLSQLVVDNAISTTRRFVKSSVLRSSATNNFLSHHGVLRTTARLFSTNWPSSNVSSTITTYSITSSAPCHSTNAYRKAIEQTHKPK